jgi:hypothetical protein
VIISYYGNDIVFIISFSVNFVFLLIYLFLFSSYRSLQNDNGHVKILQ